MVKSKLVRFIFLAVSLDATVYFGAHGTNFNVTTGGARDDYITETHHWSMEETTNWRSRMEWTDYYCFLSMSVVGIMIPGGVLKWDPPFWY